MYKVTVFDSNNPDATTELFGDRVEIKVGDADFVGFETFESMDHIVPEVIPTEEGVVTLFEAEGLNEDGTEIEPDNG